MYLYAYMQNICSKYQPGKLLLLCFEEVSNEMHIFQFVFISKLAVSKKGHCYILWMFHDSWLQVLSLS